MIICVPLLLAVQPFEYQPIDVVAATTLSFEYQVALQPTEDTDEQELVEAPSTWGTKDTWRWSIQGGYAEDVKDSSNTISIIGAEFDYFLEEDLSLDLGFNGLDIDQDGPSVGGLNFTLQLRWHFINNDNWSMFMEGGAGLLRTSQKVPSSGSRFNFTPQAGLGFTFDIGHQNRWLVGVKWHHISNANIYETNPGRDSIMVWTGISFPF